ncbi:MAG TPA: glycosyltransferase [Actinoplanes sp.]|nr:glycosyltransferase [Actinoplanes sp.]
MSAEPTVVIWRSALLAASETFVRNHGAALTRWRPRYLGATKVESNLAEDGDVIAFRDPRAFLRLRLTGSSPRLRAALAGLAPQVVHAHFGGDGWLVSRAAADLGVPLVVTVHGHDVTRQPDAPGLHGVRYRRNLRAVFRRAAVVLAVSEHIRATAIARGADPATVRVHHTGVPIPDAVPDVPKTWDVAFVGRFVEKKGAGDLLAALALMPGRPRALIIGSGPLEDELRARAAGLDVTFAGPQTPQQVARHLAGSRILAAPSRTARDGDSEGLPTTILEAAALGLPVAATRHSGIPEGVLDGETGLLSAEADPDGLAANLTRMLDDDALRARLGARGRAHVEASFDLRKQSSLLEDLYDELAVSRAACGAGRRPASR